MHNRDSIKGKIGIKVALAIVNEAKSSANRFVGERQEKRACTNYQLRNN